MDKNSFTMQSRITRHILEQTALNEDKESGLSRMLADYIGSLKLLELYDEQKLIIPDTHSEELYVLSYKDATRIIERLKHKFNANSLFGLEKGSSFKTSLAAIYQSFNGEDVYPGIEEKAANLLYFMVKNPSFADGNKRIGAFLFVWFLEKNGLLYRDDGSRRIAGNALVAITLLIDQSDPDDKSLMTRLVVNLINGNN